MNEVIEISDKTKEILTTNGLDFQIIKRPQLTLDGSITVDEHGAVSLDAGSNISRSVYYSLINESTGEELNSVKKGYTVSQNDEIIEKIVRGTKAFGDNLSVEKALSLNGGRRILVQLGIQGTAKVGGDTLVRYITIIDSNDGSTGLSVGIGNVTMSCMNQFYSFYKSGQRFRHTASLKQQIAALPQMIENALAMDMRQMETFRKFVSTPASKELVNTLVNRLVGIDRTASELELSETSTRKKNLMDSLYLNIEHEMSGSAKGDNVWGLMSGVTRWTTHDKQAPKREHGRLESLVTGTNYKTNQTAYQFLDKYVEELV